MNSGDESSSPSLQLASYDGPDSIGMRSRISSTPVRSADRVGDVYIIDGTSPEAAVCEAAYRDLEQAVGHLLTASVTSASSTGAVDARRVDTDLGPETVVVHRDHPERQSVVEESSGTKLSDNEFMQ
jgi:hypothetical protein